MKIIPSRMAIYAVAALAIVYFLLKIFAFDRLVSSPSLENLPSTEIHGTQDTVIAQLLRPVIIDTELPYSIYKQQVDSVENLRLRHKHQSEGINAGTFTAFSWGFAEYFQKIPSIHSFHRWYFVLGGYHLKDPGNRFFIHNGKNMLLFQHTDSIIKTANGNENRYMHYARKEVPVRYSLEENRILIPVSQTIFSWGQGLSIIFGGFTIAFLLYVFIIMPVQVVLAISKGQVFVAKNILRFKWMGWGLIGYSLFEILVPYLLHLCFNSMIPSEFSLSFPFELLPRIMFSGIIGVALLLIGKAFQKGAALQQENNLTI